MLILAAAYNLLWGAWVVLFPLAAFSLTGLEPPRYPQIWQCVGMIVGCYGIGYAIAATDPIRWWPLVLVGLIGKVLGPIGFVYAFLAGDFPLEFGIMILTNDLIWWLPFAAILWSAARGNETTAQVQPASVAMRHALTQTGQSLWDLTQRQPALVLCLRHAGCSFCKVALQDIASQRKKIESKGVQIILVHMALEDQAERLFAAYGLADLPRISDPHRELYRSLGLGRGSFLALFGPLVWLRGIVAGLRGHWPGRLAGDGFQMPGAFLIHRGRLVRSFRHRTAADRPDYPGLCNTNACQTIQPDVALIKEETVHAR